MMKIKASIRIVRALAGAPKQFSPFAAIVGLTETGKAVTFDVNADSDTIDKIEAVQQAFREKGYGCELAVEGGTVSENPESVVEGGVRRSQTWAGKPVHKLYGDISFNVVGKYSLPKVSVKDTFLADATAILDS